MEISDKMIKIKGRDVHYLAAGCGTALVLVHGYGGQAKKWLNTITVLSEKYTVYAPDLPGFGDSQPLDGTYYIPELVEFIEDFVTELGVKEFYLVGHSMGGGIAVNYALKNPARIIKLVLVDSLCLGKEIAWWVRLLSKQSKIIGAPLVALFKVVKWATGKLLIPQKLLPLEFSAPISQTSINLGSCVASLKQQTMIVANRLSELVMPTLLVWGDTDPIIPVEHAYQAVKVIPDCQLKIFDRTGHNIYRDNPREFSQAVTEFLG